MADRTLTTGQITGQVGISAHTLQNYVKDFRQYLSPEACRPTRGRRFTFQDVKVVFLIKHLYFQRWRPQDIRAVLSGEKTCIDLPKFEVFDEMSISQATRDYMLQAKAYAESAQKACFHAQTTVDAVSRDLSMFRKELDRVKEVGELKAKIQILESNLGKLIKAYNQEHTKQQKKIFGLL